MEQTIKLAIRGQLHEKELTPTKYFFPRNCNDDFSCIEPDPRNTLNILGLSGAGTECYTMAITTSGIIYAYRQIRPRRGDCAMVMISAPGPTVYGKRLLEKLKEILNYVLNEETSSNINDDIIREQLSECIDLFDFTKTPNPSKDEDVKSNKEAFRIFDSENSLYKILENPYQSAYKGFRCIHLISTDAESSPKIDVNLQRIDSPIEKSYYFVFPQGVEEVDGKKHVTKNDVFSLRYIREGYDDYKADNQTVGRHSKYFNVESDKIIVASADDAKILFSKEISFYVTDIDNNPVNDFEIKIKKYGSNKWDHWSFNGSIYDSLKGDDGVRKINLNDDKYAYCIEANGFEKYEDVIDVSNNTTFYKIQLKPESIEGDITFIPAFDERKSSKVKVGCKKSDVFYREYRDLFQKKNSKLYVMRKNPRIPGIIALILSFLIGLTAGGGLGFGGYYIYKQIGLNQNVPKDNDANLDSSSEDNHSQTGTNYPEAAVSSQGKDSASGHDSSAVTDSSRGTNPSAVIDSSTENANTLSSEELKKNKDITYLSKNNIWEYDNLVSEDYKTFFCKLVQKGDYRGKEYEYKTLGDYNKINNTKWNLIRESFSDTKRKDEASRYQKELTSNKEKVNLEKILSTQGTKKENETTEMPNE